MSIYYIIGFFIIQFKDKTGYFFLHNIMNNFMCWNNKLNDKPSIDGDGFDWGNKSSLIPRNLLVTHLEKILKL
jgi:hypothetical protein